VTSSWPSIESGLTIRCPVGDVRKPLPWNGRAETTK